MLASTAGVTTRMLQLSTISIALSLPPFLVPTEIMGINMTSNAIVIGGIGSLILFT